MPNPNTHFEQIPIAVVKRIAKEDLPGGQVNGNGGSTTKTPTGKLKAQPLSRKNGKRI